MGLNCMLEIDPFGRSTTPGQHNCLAATKGSEPLRLHCKDANVMKRTALVVALAATIGLGWPARADTTIKSQDGTVELTVPNGWREGKPFGPAIKVVALSARGAIVL